uniref:F-box protein 41 n=1 Tax=Latimeria chalumnae TaxID=7897 RepID=H2ZU47_LATCH
MASLDLPYRCPRCGEHKRFRSLSSLRAHLEYNHTYETLYVLSKSNSVCDAALFPLVSETTTVLTPGGRRDVFESTSFRSKELRCPYEIQRLECPESSSACFDVEIPLNEILVKKVMTSSNPPTPTVGSNATVDASYEEGLARLKVRALEKLDFDERLEKLSEEMEQKIAARVGRLQVELERRSSELEKAKQESVKLSREKQELEGRATDLSRQVDVSVEMLAALKQDLIQKEQELTRKQQDTVEAHQITKSHSGSWYQTCNLDFENYIMELLLDISADRVKEMGQSTMVVWDETSSGTGYHAGLGQNSLQMGQNVVTVERVRERNAGSGGGSRGSYPISNQKSTPGSRVSSRMKTVSLSSGCYDSDSGEMQTFDEGSGESQYYQAGGRGGEGGVSRSSALRKQAIQNWHRRPYRNSTEGEEGDVSDVGSRTTESEVEVWEQEQQQTPPETQPSNSTRAIGGCRLGTGRRSGSAGSRSVRGERGSPSRSNEVISPEILKLRAALFCIFTYLDTKTLLRAAEVCKDWKFVARHPAVWTRVLLENARISSKFMTTLSQWCTQTHSLTIQNLKPRQRGKKESKEEYMRSTRSRGCLEAGLESLLKAAGGNLLILKISHCPNILTDRSLWLASCYCRTLQAITYRSATDPVGHEVIWALGAGCRDIISLQVAPLHPCQQATRFSNRCLQMIGRCWPLLRALGVGGAGCGIQGLASLARNCIRLQVLELDHVAEINQEVAAEVCREGLKGLEMLVLTSTPVTPKALLHFNS